MTTKPVLDMLKEQIENLLYPELRLYGRADRNRLLQKASETPFDFLEWVGILGGLVLVAGLTRYGVSPLTITYSRDSADRFKPSSKADPLLHSHLHNRISRPHCLPENRT